MEKIQIIFYCISAAFGILLTGIPTLFALRKQVKARRNSTTTAERAEADLAIKNHMITLIGQAEDLYSVVDTALKAMGGSAGSVKKETVMARLQQYALDNGFFFDKEKWSAEIDETVAVTKIVNCKK